MKCLQLILAIAIFIDYDIISITSQAIRRWNPEDLIKKAIEDNPDASYFIADPNHYFESTDITSLREDLKQIYIHFHFNVFSFVFPQMTPEYSSLVADEGIDKFTNDTLNYFVSHTGFGAEDIIIIVYPIENEVIKIIGGAEVLDIYTESDLMSILKRQLDNFKDEKLVDSFHNIFQEIAHDSPHSYIMKLKYFIWRYQSLAIGLVAGVLFFLKFTMSKPQNEVLIDKMQMFVLQLKFQAKWKSHCMICLEKLPLAPKKKKDSDDDIKDEDEEDNVDDEEETENNSKNRNKRGDSIDIDEEEEDEEEEEEEEDDDDDDEEEEEERIEEEEIEEEDEDEDEKIEIKPKKKKMKKGKTNKKRGKKEKDKWEECDSKEEEEDEDKCVYVDQLRLALSQFSNKPQSKTKDKDKDQEIVKRKKTKAKQFNDIAPALSIKIRKALRQKPKKKEKKVKKKEEEKPKKTSKAGSKGHSRNNSSNTNGKNNKKDNNSLFIKKSLVKTKQEEQKPINFFKSKYTLQDQADPKNKERITLDCGHSFHRKCFDDWHEIKHTSSCPVCDYHVFSNSNQICDDSFKNRLVKLQQVIHPELKDIHISL